VEIRKNKLFTQARVDFDIKGNKGEVQDTNLREQYKLVSTVVLAFLNFANQVESLAPLTRAKIYAKSDSGQGLSIDSKRARLYRVVRLDFVFFIKSLKTMSEGSKAIYLICNFFFNKKKISPILLPQSITISFFLNSILSKKYFL
jgi:hypothetical protein